MPTMRQLQLLLLLTLIIACSLARAADTNSNSNTDYNEYEDEEASRSPGNLEKPTVPPKLPYFDQGQVIQYVLPLETSVKLDCPVKNYDAARHVILWYRNDTIITNDHQAIQEPSIYSLDKQFTLTAPAVNATGFNFSCRVMPNDVRRNITVLLGAYPEVNGATPRLSGTVSWIECFIFTALALFQATRN